VVERLDSARPEVKVEGVEGQEVEEVGEQGRDMALEEEVAVANVLNHSQSDQETQLFELGEV